MTNDISEKAEALVALIECALHKAHTQPTKLFYLQAIEDLTSKPAFKDLKAALRPSREEEAVGRVEE